MERQLLSLDEFRVIHNEQLLPSRTHCKRWVISGRVEEKCGDSRCKVCYLGN